MGSIIAAADVHRGDISVLFILIALVCLIGAGYLAYLRNFLGCVLLLLVAFVAVWLGA